MWYGRKKSKCHIAASNVAVQTGRAEAWQNNHVILPNTDLMKLKPILKTGLACALALGAFVASAADYVTTMTSLNPLGYWRLNEPTQPVVPTYSMTNISTAGSALNGAYYGVPSLQAPGANAGDFAASYSGNLQYSETPFNTALNPTGPFTVEFWANLTNVSAGAKSGVVSRYVTVAGGPTAQRGYLFFANNGNATWQFRVYNNTGSTTVTDTGIVTIAANTWYHVVGVYDGANISVYVNGVKTSTTTGTVVYAPNTNSPTRIGAGTPETAPSLFFPGQLDNVAIYNSVLSDAQISAHYDAATTNAAGYNAQILADSPAVYYPLNEPVLPPYVPYAATNSGSLGIAQNGVYSLAGSTSGIAGPLRSQFAGFETNNKAVGLNGSSGIVSIPGFATTTDSCTFTAWIKRNGSQNNSSDIIGQRQTGSPNSALVVDFSNRIGYVWNDDSATYNFNPGADFFIPDGVWTFAAVAITPTNATIYIGSTNGLKSVTRTGAHAAHDFSGGDLQIGRDGSNTGRAIKGNVDEVAIFDQALDYTSISNLFYSAAPAIPLVTVSPAAPYYEGMNVSFAAYGIGGTPVSYQWRKGGSNLTGKTASTLILTNVSTGSSGSYDVVVTGNSLSVTSEVSTITVVAGPPIIAQPPVSITRYEGAAATFSVGIQGSVPWSFQWKKGVATIAGATNTSYRIPAVTLADAGSYSVVVTNPLGSVTSSSASLVVLSTTNYVTTVMRAAGIAPLAYWRLNETNGLTAFDYAGGNNGTNTATVITGAAGPQSPSFLGFESTNTAFTFDGTAAWVQAPPLNFNTNTMTYTAWIKVAAYHPTDLAGIVFSRGDSGASGLHIVSTGELRYHWSTGSHYGFASGINVPLGQWVFVALVVEPTRGTLYMNDGSGLVSAINNVTHPVLPGTDPFFLGRDRTDRVFNGDIDEAAVYQKALSAAEIQNLSVMGYSGPTPPSISDNPVTQTVLAGQPVTFTVGAIGAYPLTYQWKHAGTNLPGATSATLTIPSVYYSDAGNYQAFVANSVGTTNSQEGTLFVEAPPSFAYLTNDLVLHLKFDGNCLDSSGHANDGTANDLTPGVSYVPGKIGSNGVLVGTNGFVTLVNTADLSFGPSDSFSVAFWVKCGPGNNDIPIMGNAINSTYQAGFVFSEDADKLEWTITSYGGGTQTVADPVPGSPIITDGAWHNVVVTFDRTNSTATTYVDGSQVDSRSIAGLGSLDNGNSITFGNDPTGTYIYDPVTYQIDDVGIWRRALTPGQATGIYAAGQVGQSFDVIGPGSLTSKKTGNALELIWQQGTLQTTTNLLGGWVNVPGAVAPYATVPTTNPATFYRVKF